MESTRDAAEEGVVGQSRLSPQYAYSIQLSPALAAKLLAAAVGALVLASTAGQISTYYFGHGRLFGFVALFALDEEANIPTWYSSITLLSCSLLLWIVARAQRLQRDRWCKHWAALGLIFFYLSVDEAATIHELSIEPLHALVGVGGLLRWAWVIPGMALVAALGIAYFQFMLALPQTTRRLLFIAAALFIGGALIMEMLSGWWFDRYGGDTMSFSLFWTAEETLEMAGVAVFIYALLRYLQEELGVARISFGATPPPPSTASGYSAVE